MSVQPQKVIFEDKPWYWDYYWFITSVNDLVVLGKNVQQNEALVKRLHRDKNARAFVHVDGGSKSGTAIIFRSEVYDSEYPVDPRSLEQAGQFVVSFARWKHPVTERPFWCRKTDVSLQPSTKQFRKKILLMIRMAWMKRCRSSSEKHALKNLRDCDFDQCWHNGRYILK